MPTDPRCPPAILMFAGLTAVLIALAAARGAATGRVARGDMPPPPPSLAAVRAGRIEQAKWLVFGPDSGKLVYFLADPDCPYSRNTWEQFQTALAAGEIQLRVIPVGLFSPKSLGEAVAVALAPNPQKAWIEAMAGRLPPVDPLPLAAADDLERTLERIDGEAERQGKPLSAEQKTALRLLLLREADIGFNHRLMADQALAGTPILFWRDARGHFRRHDGQPEAAEMREILASAQPSGR